MGTSIEYAAQYREEALRRLGQLPPFSPVLTQLVATLAQADVSFVELAGLIEKDTVLAGHVLRVVNSAAYGLRGTVNSVRHAVSLMGIVKLRNVALSLSVARLWSTVHTPDCWNMAEFNEHSVATGIVADLLAQRLPVDYGEGAFTAGLMHDVGKLLIAVALPAEFERVAAAGGSVEAERNILGFDHSDLSGAVLVRWNLPAAIREAAERHHSPREASNGMLRLEQVVAAADATVRSKLEGAARPIEELGVQDAQALLAEFTAEFGLVGGGL